MFSRRTLLALVLTIASVGCGGSGSPAAPSTPLPPAAPTVTSLSLSSPGGCTTGSVCNTPANLTLTATAQFSDGTTQNVTSQAQWTTSNASVASVSAGAVTATNTGDTDVFANYQGRSAGLTVRVLPPWTRSGIGNTVFDMPTYITRVRVQGRWNGQQNSNFVVLVNGRLLVNEILRGTPGLSYDGLHVTTGGVTSIQDSTFISWTLTQVR